MADPTPDCFHCRWFHRQLPQPFICTQHDIKLPVPVRVVCTAFADPDEELELDASDLDPAMIYVWVETVTRDPNGQIEHHLDLEPLASIKDYPSWTRVQFFETVRLLTVRKHAHYRQQGYQIAWLE